MPILRIIRGNVIRHAVFEGTPVLGDVLTEAGFAMSRPCGGRGVCGKCAVSLSGTVAPPTEMEQRVGCRLSCQAVLLGDCEVVLGEAHSMEQIEAGAQEAAPRTASLGERLGAAVDIGTTTIALRLMSLEDGRLASTAAAINPQTTVCADVMNRIGSALNGMGARMQQQVLGTIRDLLHKACEQSHCRCEQVKRMVICGNTTMLYLLTGRRPESLAAAPFEADMLFGHDERILDILSFLPRCIHAFAGADLTCAMLYTRMHKRNETTLLCDIGTNGEIALRHKGRLWVTSTAAGPAFEGAGIVMGCGSVRGAVDRVQISGSALCVHTIGGAPAVGLCGSGLIDAVAAFLKTGDIDETGATEAEKLEIENGVCLYPQDIRSVQTAKAAIAAGIETLLARAEVLPEAISRVYIAGGFGSHLNLESAAAIGLLPPVLAQRAQAVGNAALLGAEEILQNSENREKSNSLACMAEYVNLGGDPEFNAAYIENMLFPEQVSSQTGRTERSKRRF